MIPDDILDQAVEQGRLPFHARRVRLPVRPRCAPKEFQLLPVER